MILNFFSYSFSNNGKRWTLREYPIWRGISFIYATFSKKKDQSDRLSPQPFFARVRKTRLIIRIRRKKSFIFRCPFKISEEIAKISHGKVRSATPVFKECLSVVLKDARYIFVGLNCWEARN